MNTYIIYHSRDLDGYTSGAIVKKKFPEGILLGYDYGKPFPEIPNGQTIFMVDVTIPVPQLLMLADRSDTVTVIDHHISFMNEVNQYVLPGNLIMELNDKRAACELTWEYLFPGELMPMAVFLLGEYDTWRNQDMTRWEKRILPFQYGMRMICQSAETWPTSLFNDNTADGTWPVQVIIDKGATILEYQQLIDERAMRGAFEFEWRGYKILAVNAGGINSNAFKSRLDNTKHDIMMPFYYNGKSWNFSLYTEKDIDCSVLAKAMGGGGHKKAAGFQVTTVDELPFILA